MGRWRLWKDVPHEQRIDEHWIFSRNGAYDDKWVDKRIDRLFNPRCEVAVKCHTGELWHPCGVDPLGGAKRCCHHGGPVKNKKRWIVKKSRKWLGRKVAG